MTATLPLLVRADVDTSHRAQHREAAQALDVMASFASKRPSAGQYAALRHRVAATRREEQHRARIAAGTDRATLRAARARGEG